MNNNDMNNIIKELLKILSIGSKKFKNVSDIFKNQDESSVKSEIKRVIDMCTSVSNNLFDITWFSLDIFDVSNSLVVGRSQRIINGLKEGLDVSWYANLRFNWYQMCEIYRGLKEGLDVSIYANPRFDYHQMKQIREGLKDGIDVSIYIGKPDGSELFDDMTMYRCRLLLNRGINVFEEFKKYNKNLYEFNTDVIENIFYCIVSRNVDYKKLAKYINKEHSVEDLYDIISKF